MKLPTFIKRNQLVQRFLGFGSIGVFMTLLANVFLYVLLELFSWNVFVAYTIVSLVNIGITYFLNGKFVFKKSFNWSHLGGFYLAYLSGMLVGLIALAGFKSFLAWNDFILSCLILPITIVWNFTFINLIFERFKVSLQAEASS